jgi:hypothetical protein
MGKPRYTVTSRSSWSYLDEEAQTRGYRIYLVTDHRAEITYYAADYKLCGKVPKDSEHERVPLDAQTRMQAWNAAKRQCAELPLPLPAQRSA